MSHPDHDPRPTWALMTLCLMLSACGGRSLPGGVPAGDSAPAAPAADMTPRSDAGACDYTDPQRTWISKDPKTCAVIDYGCQNGWGGFEDACGCGCQKQRPCGAQEASVNGLCLALFGYYWDGKGCWSGSGCGCKGKDCADDFSSELACLAAFAHCRTPASNKCARTNNDACTRDSDCKAGGCSGELCYNPKASSGISDCDCSKPAGLTCGCVAGHCGWWK